MSYDIECQFAGERRVELMMKEAAKVGKKNERKERALGHDLANW